MDRLRVLFDRRHDKAKNEHRDSEPDARAASLPTDLILDIFLRLEPAAVIRCAAVCKPWRHTIIGNAAILGAHLDRFQGPSLQLGVFHYYITAACLLRTPGPFQSALPSNCSGGDVTFVHKLMPAAASAAVPSLLWCKDGFILLRARSVNSLCLCNPITGYCRILPAAAAAMRSPVIQVWVLSDDGDDSGSRWTRQRTIQLSVNDLLSHCPEWSHCHPIVKVPWTFHLSAFFPRSRCVVVSWSGRGFLVDIGSGGSHSRVVRNSGSCPTSVDLTVGHTRWIAHQLTSPR